MSATVMPRPIAWVTSLNEDGSVNAAPFSYFNVLSYDPPMIGVSVTISDNPVSEWKDTANNILREREFAVNLVPEDMGNLMNLTATDFDPLISETDRFGMQTVPSHKIRTPRLTGCPVSFEVGLEQEILLGDKWKFVVGRVSVVHVEDRVVSDPDKFYFDVPAMKLIGRMHGSWYVKTSNMFQMERMPLE